jgi:RHS repeat-associated protein
VRPWNSVSANGSPEASYLYNDKGIRVETSVTGGGTTHFLIDDNNQTGYAQVLEELPGFGQTATRSYVLGDDVLAQSVSTATNYFLPDGHGNNRQLVGMTGSVSYHYDYEAYGAVQSSISSSDESDAATTKLYCGEQYDSTPGMGMYNLRARYYDPLSGRFNQRDTFAGHVEDPQSLHKYLYCNCDPGNRVDPTGCWSMVEILVTIGIILNIAGFLLHAYGAFEERASGNNLAADEDEAWAMIDFLFLLIPGSGLIGSGFQFAGYALQISTSLLKAGVAASAVWGYVTTLFSVIGNGSGGVNSGSGSTSSEGADGPGEWQTETKSGSADSQLYEIQNFGRQGQCYSYNGVKWDGWDPARRVLIESKYGYSFQLDDWGAKSGIDWAGQWRAAAENWIKHAGNHPVEVRFSDKGVADMVTEAVKGLNITVKYVPFNM